MHVCHNMTCTSQQPIGPTMLQSTILWTHNASDASLQNHDLSLQTAHDTRHVRSCCTGDGECPVAESHHLSVFSLLYIAVLAWLHFLNSMCFFGMVSQLHMPCPPPPLFRLLGFHCVAVLCSQCGFFELYCLSPVCSAVFLGFVCRSGGLTGPPG